MTTHSLPVVVGVHDKQPTTLRWALAEAARLHTGLRVVHCWSIPMISAEAYLSPELVDSVRSGGQEILDGAREILEGEPTGVPVEYVLVDGAPSNALVGEARTAAVLVVGADDVTWFDRLLGGEVAAYVARHASCPVVVVPERDMSVADAGNVVVAVDGESAATGPIRYGFDQADDRDVPLLIVNGARSGRLIESVGMVQADFDDQRADVAEIMAGWQELYPDVPVSSTTQNADPVDECISATSDASLVVIGRPRHHGLPFLHDRSIAERVLRGAHCPVAIVDLDDERS